MLIGSNMRRSHTEQMMTIIAVPAVLQLVGVAAATCLRDLERLDGLVDRLGRRLEHHRIVLVCQAMKLHLHLFDLGHTASLLNIVWSG
jgi:hypothetical protein